MNLERIFEFAGNHVVLVTALLLMLFLVIFHEVRRKTQGTFLVTPAEAVTWINRGTHVIDVRNAEQYRAGHIVGARHVPADSLNASNSWLSKQRKKPLLVTCDTGQASTRAVGELRKQGFEQVYSLRGGINAWRQENLPVVRDEPKNGGGDKPAAKKNRSRDSRENAA